MGGVVVSPNGLHGRMGAWVRGSMGPWHGMCEGMAWGHGIAAWHGSGIRSAACKGGMQRQFPMLHSTFKKTVEWVLMLRFDATGHGLLLLCMMCNMHVDAPTRIAAALEESVIQIARTCLNHNRSCVCCYIVEIVHVLQVGQQTVHLIGVRRKTKCCLYQCFLYFNL